MKSSESVENYIDSLPGVRRRLLAKGRSDSPPRTTRDMMDAENDRIDVLIRILVGLARYYPNGHFGAEEPLRYFESLAESFFEWHIRRLQTDGKGSGGSQVQVLAQESVCNELERLVIDVVRVFAASHERIDFDDWLRRWTANS
jgi:hypothetical protein